MTDVLDQLVGLERTKRLVIFTGAGISADSGIKTFRDSGGLWEGHSPDVVANGLTWKKNRNLVIRFYNERRVQAGQAEPNAAHRAIAEWQQKYGAYVITQNVDSLLEKADVKQVLHVHGSLLDMKCEACGHHWSIGYVEWGVEARCRCGSVKGTRPDVVFFHEPAPNYSIMHKAFNALREGDVLLVMGTSGQVINITNIAFERPCTTILSNLETMVHEPSNLRFERLGVHDNDFDYVIHGRAAETVGQIDALLATLMAPAASPEPEATPDHAE